MAYKPQSRRESTSNQRRFAHVPEPTVPRSRFDRTHGLKTAFNSGYLVPILVDEALPGDTFNLSATVFGRLATPIHPVMENLWLDTFFFAVPLRLLWENWQRFNGEQDNPDDSTDFTCPQVTSGAEGFEEETLFDYMGVPTKVPNLAINAFHARAYNRIWNEFFRSENVQDSVINETGDGPEASLSYTLLKRNKRHDYFTAGLPWAQKGPAVRMNLGEDAPVTITPDGFGPSFQEVTENGEFRLESVSSGKDVLWGEADDNSGQFLKWASDQGHGLEAVADLSNATAATINELREAITLQQLYERDARSGTRYTEVIRGHFGVNTLDSDARLQRPEFLGGGSQAININPVAQTSETETTPQGNLSAFGVVSGSGGGFTQSFTEHCVIIGLAMVRADLNYQQGLHRMWSRTTRWDFYWPTLANLGEQEIKNKEIYAQGPTVNLPADPTLTADEDVFAFQERYAEYRYKPSMITGPMRSNHTTPLDTWHLAQDFDSLPQLNSEFLEENPPIDRVVAVTDEPDILLDCHFRYLCARPMPVYSVPGLNRL